MHETYSLKEAMDRLGLKSANVFFQLERKYPSAFIVVKRKSGKETHSRKDIHYHKATLDGFAERRENIKQEIP